MEARSFSRDTLMTVLVGGANFVVAMATSVMIARVLGPEGKGIYSLAALLPSLIVTLSNLGVNSATVYFAAQAKLRQSTIFGNNLLLALGIGAVAGAVGYGVVSVLPSTSFSGVPRGYLLFALVLVPAELIYSFTTYHVLGLQHIGPLLRIRVLRSVSLLLFVCTLTWALHGGVIGTLIAVVAALAVSDGASIALLWRRIGAPSCAPDRSYIAGTLRYGIQTYLVSLVGFLNYRIDMLIVAAFLSPVQVGFYSLGVGIVEQLWIVSQAASTLLLPRVTAETDEGRRREFTPLVMRAVLIATGCSAVALMLSASFLVRVLYSDAFLPAVSALKALLIGIVALSASRVLANDIAGRGRPSLNTAPAVLSLGANVALNFLWIPRYGIVGAAWASTASYTLNLVAQALFYCHISGNSVAELFIPTREDWRTWKRAAATLMGGRARDRKTKRTDG